jgi:hypothetical protein
LPRIRGAKLFTVVFLAVFLLSDSRAQQNPWADYQRRTLQSVIDMHVDSTPQLDFLLSAHSFPSQVRLAYVGNTRPVTGKRLELLRKWVKMTRHPESVVELFQREVLFREGNKAHWLPVQKPLIEALKKEVKPGGAINAYVIFMGGAKFGHSWEWLFGMNEFDNR